MSNELNPFLLPEATPSVKGAMSAADKTKLDGIPLGGGGAGGFALLDAGTADGTVGPFVIPPSAQGKPAIQIFTSIGSGDAALVRPDAVSYDTGYTQFTFNSLSEAPPNGADMWVTIPVTPAPSTTVAIDFRWTTGGATTDGVTLTYAIPSPAAGKVSVIPGDGKRFYTNFTLNPGKTQVTFDAGQVPPSGSALEFFYCQEVLAVGQMDADTVSGFDIGSVLSPLNFVVVGDASQALNEDIDYFFIPEDRTITKVIVFCADTPGSGTITVDLLKADNPGSAFSSLYTLEPLPTLACTGSKNWTVYSSPNLPDVTLLPQGSVLVARVVSAPSGLGDLKVVVI